MQYACRAQKLRFSPDTEIADVQFMRVRLMRAQFLRRTAQRKLEVCQRVDLFGV